MLTTLVGYSLIEVVCVEAIPDSDDSTTEDKKPTNEHSVGRLCFALTRCSGNGVRFGAPPLCVCMCMCIFV